jgi:hypothetical protein
VTGKNANTQENRIQINGKPLDQIDQKSITLFSIDKGITLILITYFLFCEARNPFPCPEWR